MRTSQPPIEDAQMLEEMNESAALPTIHGLREAVQKAGGLVPEQPKRPELATVETRILDSWRLRHKMAVPDFDWVRLCVCFSVLQGSLTVP